MLDSIPAWALIVGAAALLVVAVGAVLWRLAGHLPDPPHGIPPQHPGPTDTH